MVEVDIKIVPGDAAWVPSGGHGQRGLRSIISLGDSEPGQEDVEVVINNMEFSASDVATDWERANGAANLLHRFGLVEWSGAVIDQETTADTWILGQFSTAAESDDAISFKSVDGVLYSVDLSSAWGSQVTDTMFSFGFGHNVPKTVTRFAMTKRRSRFVKQIEEVVKLKLSSQ